eukprot:1136305-Pelagomonas_calceolata.AAC.3
MPSKGSRLLSTPYIHFIFRVLLGGGSWVRGGGGREKESLSVQEHGRQPFRSPVLIASSSISGCILG